MARKYGIIKGIFMFEETNNLDNRGNRYRTILFQPLIIDRSVQTFRDFARMMVKCIDISKSFQKVIQYVNEISIQDLLNIKKLRNAPRAD